MVSTASLSMDERVQRDVLDELHCDGQVKPTEIGVDVHDGIVTLTGTIADVRKRTPAIDAARRLYSVRGRVKKFEVKPANLRKRGETGNARSSVRASEWEVSAPQDRVKVRASDSVTE